MKVSSSYVTTFLCLPFFIEFSIKLGSFAF